MNGNGDIQWPLAETLNIPIHEKGTLRPTTQTVYRDPTTGQWTTAPTIVQTTEPAAMNTDIVTSEDANVVSNFFNNVANRIIQASELAKKLDQLQHDFEQLKQEVEKYREDNARLDEEVNRLRAERNDLQSANAQILTDFRNVSQELEHTRTALDTTRRESDTWQSSYNTAWNDLALAKSDRDNANWRVVELEEKLRVVSEERDMFRSSSERNANLLAEIRSRLDGTTIIAQAQVA
jgi:DNA repair exonuclease SbcCD ATPase subunit